MDRPECSIANCEQDATRELDLNKRKDKHSWHPYCSKHTPVGPITGERDLQLDLKEKTTERVE